MVKILEGLRIVEGAAFVAAPLAGMTLAQMGADVIRFDRIRGGLDNDRWPVTEKGRSLFWAGLNKGKRSIAVDMTTPEGQEIVTRLICAPGPQAGIYLTNLRVRGWMDYDALRLHREDLIMLSVKDDRAGGPQVDYIVNPAVGFPAATGPRGSSEPVGHVLRRGTASRDSRLRSPCLVISGSSARSRSTTTTTRNWETPCIARTRRISSARMGRG